MKFNPKYIEEPKLRQFLLELLREIEPISINWEDYHLHGILPVYFSSDEDNLDDLTTRDLLALTNEVLDFSVPWESNFRRIPIGDGSDTKYRNNQ
jgi:hypothetical protein